MPWTLCRSPETVNYYSEGGIRIIIGKILVSSNTLRSTASSPTFLNLSRPPVRSYSIDKASGIIFAIYNKDSASKGGNYGQYVAMMYSLRTLKDEKLRSLDHFHSVKSTLTIHIVHRGAAY